MKLFSITSVVFCCLLIAGTGFSQAPANDNFANRTLLSGDSVLFTGTLDDATIESGEPNDSILYGDYPPLNRSVWWSWTAASSTPVTLIALGYSQESLYSTNYPNDTAMPMLAVYAGTNILDYLISDLMADPVCKINSQHVLEEP